MLQAVQGVGGGEVAQLGEGTWFVWGELVRARGTITG